MDSIVLLPRDVPGAMLKENLSLEDHSVNELKRWLECRSLKQTGSKDELIKRINDCIDNGGRNKIFLGIDQGKWYDMKRSILQNPSSSKKGSINIFEENLIWSRFPSRPLPQYFNKGHIFTYTVNESIENENPEVIERDDDSIVTVKPFRRGSQYVESDHLNQIYDSLVRFNCHDVPKSGDETPNKDDEHPVTIGGNRTTSSEPWGPASVYTVGEKSKSLKDSITEAYAFFNFNQ